MLTTLQTDLFLTLAPRAHHSVVLGLDFRSKLLAGELHDLACQVCLIGLCLQQLGVVRILFVSNRLNAIKVVHVLDGTGTTSVPRHVIALGFCAFSTRVRLVEHTLRLILREGARRGCVMRVTHEVHVRRMLTVFVTRTATVSVWGNSVIGLSLWEGCTEVDSLVKLIVVLCCCAVIVTETDS